MKLLTFSFLLFASSLLGNGIGIFHIELFKGPAGESFKSNILTEDSNGNLYTGFDGGVKIFKGGRWEDFYLSEEEVKHIVPFRSRKLLIGGDDYFTLIEVDSLGKIIADPISKSLENELPFAFLHRFIEYNGGTFIHLDNHIIRLNDQIIDYKLNDVTYAASFNQNVIIQRLNQGLFIYAGNDFRKINSSESFANVEIQEIVDLQDGAFLLLYDGGSVYYNGENFRKIAIEEIDKVEIISGSSNENGLFLCTSDQRILQINTKDWRLQRQTNFDGWCNAFFSDSNDNLWIASNDGVAILKPRSPFHLLPFGDEEGRAGLIIDDQLLLGTNRGTYTSSLGRFLSSSGYENMRQLNNDYVNQLNTVRGKLVVAAKNNEDFGRNVNQLFYLEESETLLKADKSGLGFYEYNYGRWNFGNHIYGLEEEVYSIIEDDLDRIWVHSARSGVVLLNFDKVLNTISPEVFEISNLQSESINGVFLINGLPVLTTKKGVYTLSKEEKGFEKSSKFNEIFGKGNSIEFFYQDEDEDIWYISEEECGILKLDDEGLNKTVRKLRIPEMQNHVNLNHGGIIKIGSSDFIVNAKDGFLHVDKSKIVDEEALSIGIHRISLAETNESFIISNNEKDISHLKEGETKIKLSLFSNFDHFDEELLYSYKLDEGNWTNWTKECILDLDLKGGKNIISIKGKKGLNTFSIPFEREVNVLQKWYRKSWFYYLVGSFGLLSGGLLIYFVRRLLRRRMFRINTLLQENRDQKRQIRELMEKNEVLGAQLISAASDSGIEQQLRKIGDEFENPEVKKAVKKLSKKIKSERKETERLIVVDPEFTSRLKLKYPKLSKKDIKLCTMLKMALTTKEIAPVLDISVRGVEISRYRLRKKLEISNEISLADFLKKI